MISEKKVTEIIGEYLRDSETFLIDVIIKPNNNIRVFIDGDHGVSIDDCRNLSRHLEHMLDREREDFDLTVSSAGADRPLQLPRQYLKYYGKTLEVVVQSGSRFEGTILNADPTGIKIEQEIIKSKKEKEKKIVELKYSDIKSAKPVLSFKRT